MKRRWMRQYTFRYRPANIAVLRASEKDFRENILLHPDVLFAYAATIQPREELPVPGHNLFVNKINAAQRRFPTLNGAGITVSIKEFRFDSADVDFKNRAAASPNAASFLTTHAGIMATLVGGAGNSDHAGQGAAPACILASSDFTGLLPDADYRGQNVSVQNHAYGAEIENYYGANALDVLQLGWESSKNLINRQFKNFVI